MSDLTITILRVACTKVTDSLAEGGTDEFGWRLLAKDAKGDKSLTREEIPMAKMTDVSPGTDKKLNKELPALGPQWKDIVLEFWEKDTFSSNDLLGRVVIRRKGDGQLDVSAGETTSDLGDGRFRLTGGGGDYRVQLKLAES